MNKTLIRKRLSRLEHILEKCGGPGSGVPGPCPTGRKEDNPLSRLHVDEEQKKKAYSDKEKQIALLTRKDGHTSPEAMKEMRDRLDARLKDACQRARPFMAVEIQRLEKILDEGFKNQFETGTTRGSSNLEYRKSKEGSVMGVPESSKPEDRPKYGYLSEKEPDDGGNHSTASYYGDTIVEFHDHVKDRATITGQDSFHQIPVVASPCRKPSIDSLGSDSFLYNDDNETNRIPPVTNGVDKVVGGYVELQVHGKLTAKDVRAVYLEGINAGIYNQVPEFVERHRSIIKKLQELGIEVRFNGGHPDYNKKLLEG